MCIDVFPVCVLCACLVLTEARRGLQTFHASRLGFQMVVRHYVGGGDLTWALGTLASALTH